MYLLQQYCQLTGLNFVLQPYSWYLSVGFNACVLVQVQTIVTSVTQVIALHKA